MATRRRVERTIFLWKEYKRDKTAMLGLGVVIATILAAILAPLIAPYDPWAFVSKPLAPPSAENWFGTDALGRDVLSRIIWGTRVSLLFGIVCAGLSGFVGIVLGAIAGYYGGLLGGLLSRIFEFVIVIPTIFLLILVIALFGSNLNVMMIIVGMTMWPWIARIMRAQVLSLKSKTYVLATENLGASNFRILFRHIVPNGLYPIVANVILQIAFAILTEASLSFLALGDVNQVSWGQILYWGHIHIQTSWWDTIFAGLAIAVATLGFTLLGDRLNNILDPKIDARTGLT